MTRAQIADPDLGRKAQAGRGREIRECVGLNVCVARRLRKFPIGCVQNPDAGFELRASLAPRPQLGTCSSSAPASPDSRPHGSLLREDIA